MSDDFYDHPKFQRVGALGVALWTSSLAWSNRNLTDGVVPRGVARRLLDFEDVVAAIAAAGNAIGNGVTNGAGNRGGNPAGNPDDHAFTAAALRTATISTLIAAGLWREHPDGYLIHDYLDYQKSAEQIHAERDKNAARQRAFKERRKQARKPPPADGNDPGNGEGNGVTNPPSNGDSNGITHDVTNSPVTDAPNPNPNTPSSYEEGGERPGSEIPDDTPEREDIEQVCLALADAVEANGSRRPNITKTWRREARLLMDKDGRTVDQVLTAIAWCQADPFWRANVLSLPKLREKYDQLRLAAQRQQVAATRPPAGQSAGPGYDPTTGTDLFDRAMERAEALMKEDQ
ncbi:hypothetical protein [Streptomyces tagetis]|uniref:Uncharacterized protein n=1 Tax=Streptomyces tagetis TaxID=2820809 RepID=A0A940XMT7_9ACTN|nr:hypothetical protein [Streptomyces sp. RG38]MBQ0827660.1 hypothetical protein [Streptomyces sp. RG38]